ncbi:hypothetical protein M514_11831 [Trichuris suis]|uniref:Uncharacterized protein n=1 Tax=Trichuris suis TaxID=68888 RepID=A0A085LQS5_9BILA|nr:hypothetical protein M513_11831 [Trichuris suis]KFD62142.1 hypothetical protein M514_11831 [Trichuris suis]
MEKALKASAVAEHIAQCKDTFQAKIVCYESNLRRIKEALYITYNTTFNRDLGENDDFFARCAIYERNACLFSLSVTLALFALLVGCIV